MTIIGAGNMGRGIGTRALAGGHDVEILDRDPAEARALADALGQAATGGATATAIEAAAVRRRPRRAGAVLRACARGGGAVPGRARRQGRR